MNINKKEKHKPFAYCVHGKRLSVEIKGDEEKCLIHVSLGTFLSVITEDEIVIQQLLKKCVYR